MVRLKLLMINDMNFVLFYSDGGNHFYLKIATITDLTLDFSDPFLLGNDRAGSGCNIILTDTNKLLCSTSQHLYLVTIDNLTMNLIDIYNIPQTGYGVFGIGCDLLDTNLAVLFLNDQEYGKLILIDTSNNITILHTINALDDDHQTRRPFVRKINATKAIYGWESGYGGTYVNLVTVENNLLTKYTSLLLTCDYLQIFMSLYDVNKILITGACNSILEAQVLTIDGNTITQSQEFTFPDREGTNNGDYNTTIPLENSVLVFNNYSQRTGNWPNYIYTYYNFINEIVITDDVITMKESVVYYWINLNGSYNINNKYEINVNGTYDIIPSPLVRYYINGNIKELNGKLIYRD